MLKIAKVTTQRAKKTKTKKTQAFHKRKPTITIATHSIVLQLNKKSLICL